MAAASIDKFKRTSNQTATTLSAPGHTSGGTTITVGSTSRWPTTTGVVFAIDMVTLNGTEEVQVPNSYTLWNGVVTSATTIGSMVLSDESPNSDQDYPAGSLTRVYMPVSAGLHNDLVEGILLHANQDGSLITSAVQTALGLGSTPTAGWSPMAQTITAVTQNGNRSETLTFSASVASVLSPGMRLQTQRTVAAPTQCTSLNGTTQYYSKTSPSGMTFTDDFVVGVWIKVSSYPTSTPAAIVSRYNGTNGWALRLETSGQLMLIGTNASSSNFSYVQSYQSVPLNKWVYVSAQLDMSAFTSTVGAEGVRSWVMIDGVEVPSSVARGGTNPIALVQAGDFMVGYAGSGYNYFPGKIAQPFVSSAKITQANVRTLMSQGLTPALISAHSIISAYSFDNSITDLNTTSANNLTANGSAVATNADSPFGGQGDGTISSTLDYGIVQAVSASTVTVQVAEGCTIPTSGGVSAVSYSTQKNPYNFPAQKGKWRIESLVKVRYTQTSPVTGTWYNLSSTNSVNMGAMITLPIGEYNFGYEIPIYIDRAAAGGLDAYVTLSTANNTESEKELTGFCSSSGGSAHSSTLHREKPVTIAAATPYYMNLKSGQASAVNLLMLGDLTPSKVYAENSYL